MVEAAKALNPFAVPINTEAAKAQNPFAIAANTENANQLEISNHCPHMARLGVCLEPVMCFLIHKIEVPAEMTA